jgi:hypothetical protein
MPVLVVHGVGDRYVPSRFSQALYDAAPEPKRLLLVDGATHNSSMLVGKIAYRRALIDLFGFNESLGRTHAVGLKAAQPLHDHM